VKAGAVVSAVLTLVLLTVVPLMAPSIIPPEMAEVISRTGFNLTGFLNQIAVIGVVSAALTLGKGLASERSPIYLLLSVASSGATLLFMLTTLSLGDTGNLGVTSISVDLGEVTSSITIDMSLFVEIAAISIVLKVIHSILEFREARAQDTQSAHPYVL